VPIVAISGEGIKALVVRIPEARAADVPERPEAVHWAEIGRIVFEKFENKGSRNKRITFSVTDA